MIIGIGFADRPEDVIAQSGTYLRVRKSLDTEDVLNVRYIIYTLSVCKHITESGVYNVPHVVRIPLNQIYSSSIFTAFFPQKTFLDIRVRTDYEGRTGG